MTKKRFFNEDGSVNMKDVDNFVDEITETSEVEHKLMSLGWEFTGTGGGCTAYIINLDDDAYWILTSLERECTAPIRRDEICVVGFSDSNGDYNGHITVRLTAILNEQVMFGNKYPTIE